MNDEFLLRLERGSSLLGAGDAEGARAELAAAVALRPDDPGARSLLAQAEFKRGAHEAAAALYDELIRDNPAEPALRVNLGLVHLKAGRIDEAVASFRAACELAPEHRKARGYLGLALARRGEPAAAREEFLRAGEEAMARRMERLLAEAGGGGAVLGPKADGDDGEVADVAEGALARLEIDEQPFAPAGELPATEGWEASGPPPEEPVGTPGLLPPPLGRVPALATFIEFARLPLPPDGPFATGAFGAAVEVRGGLLTRLDGVYGARGALGFEPAQKRFRGKPTDRSFGEGDKQVFRVRGKGSLLISPEDSAGRARTLAALRLADEEAFFCEEPLFAFDESLEFENGRVPGPAGDLPLVRLGGSGHVLLATSRRVRTLPVSGASLRVPSSRLVGWTGTLAPRLLPLDGGPEQGLGVGVELQGEGDVLLVP